MAGRTNARVVSRTLAGRRTVLRPVDDADIPGISEWWAEAATTVRGTLVTDAAAELRSLLDDAEVLVITKPEEARPIGVLAYELPAEGWLEFRLLAMEAGRRGWGHGSEAVFMVEDSGLAERFAANVYHANGLGLYFWTRIGYRPAAPGEVPWQEREPEDMITLVRQTAA